MTQFEIWPVEGLPEIAANDDLASLVVRLQPLQAGDIVVFSQKVISKAEGAVVKLASVEPTQRATALADGRDPRFVQVVLDQSAHLLRERPVLICETHHGFICANAGVDQSNSGPGEVAVLLPSDPDASARTLRAELSAAAGGPVAVVIADSFGRAWRTGQCDLAIGCAGISPLEDLRGESDRNDRILSATLVATADQIAAAADLARGKSTGHAVVLLRGLKRHITASDGPGATALLRERSKDLFR